MNRRELLCSGLSLATFLAAPVARAGAGGRRMVFVFAPGGWDPTRVLAPVFGTAAAMEPDAAQATAGGLTYVDHPDRPSVRAFFDAHHGRCTIVNGLLVPSVAHEACTRILLTGSTDDGRPDWPAVVAAARAEEHLLPGLVIAGPSYAGPLGIHVVRTGTSGQLAGLVDGQAVKRTGADGLLPASSDAVDRFLAQRAAARATAARGAREVAATGAFVAGLDQLAPLRGLAGELSFEPPLSAGGMKAHVPLAVDALSLGVARAVVVAHDAGWDSHVSNDDVQSPAWEGLFDGLAELVDALAAAPSPDGGVLADDTTIVVLSEMGRTPALNGDLGKDHWPFTSALLIGPAFVGDRVIGAFDDLHEGRRVDPVTGEPSDTGVELSPAVFGATLLAAADVDPAEWLPGVAPLSGALA